MRRITLTLALLALGTFPTASADISRTYSYFSIGGKTLSEIEEQLRSRGPHVQSTGQRHPGATRMEFKTRITYEEENRRCRIADVKAGSAKTTANGHAIERVNCSAPDGGFSEWKNTFWLPRVFDGISHGPGGVRMDPNMSKGKEPSKAQQKALAAKRNAPKTKGGAAAEPKDAAAVGSPYTDRAKPSLADFLTPALRA